jgi:hypothetical protein
MYETYAVNATDGNCKILRDGLSDTEYDMGLNELVKGFWASSLTDLPYAKQASVELESPKWLCRSHH